MKVIIVGAGAGEVGTHLARMLNKVNNDIVLIDEDPEKLQRISNQADGILSIIFSPVFWKR